MLIKFGRSKIDPQLNLWCSLFSEFFGWSRRLTVKWARDTKLVSRDNKSIWQYDHPQTIAMHMICMCLLRDKLQPMSEDIARGIIAEVEGRVAELNQYIPDFGEIDLKWYHAEVMKIVSEYQTETSVPS